MNYNSFSERLKEERIRLNLSQSEIANICGISREMWGRYERGLAVPGGEVLMLFTIEGADTNYILTGERKRSLSEVLEPEEKVLLNAYRELSDKNKKDILISILAGGSKKEKKEKGYAKTEIKGDNISNSGNINSPINSDNMNIANNSINIGNNISGGKNRK